MASYAKYHAEFRKIAPKGEKELRKAYLRRAMELHPDRGGSTEDFVHLSAAFEAISAEFGSIGGDEESRRNQSAEEHSLVKEESMDGIFGIRSIRKRARMASNENNLWSALELAHDGPKWTGGVMDYPLAFELEPRLVSTTPDVLQLVVGRTHLSSVRARTLPLFPTQFTSLLGTNNQTPPPKKEPLAQIAPGIDRLEFWHQGRLVSTAAMCEDNDIVVHGRLTSGKKGPALARISSWTQGALFGFRSIENLLPRPKSNDTSFNASWDDKQPPPFAKTSHHFRTQTVESLLEEAQVMYNSELEHTAQSTNASHIFIRYSSPGVNHAKILKTSKYIQELSATKLSLNLPRILPWIPRSPNHSDRGWYVELARRRKNSHALHPSVYAITFALEELKPHKTP